MERAYDDGCDACTSGKCTLENSHTSMKTRQRKHATKTTITVNICLAGVGPRCGQWPRVAYLLHLGALLLRMRVLGTLGTCQQRQPVHEEAKREQKVHRAREEHAGLHQHTLAGRSAGTRTHSRG